MRKEIFLAIALFALLLAGMLCALPSSDAATPAPQKVTEMTPQATVTPADYLYVVTGATPASRKANVEAVVRAGIIPVSISGLNVVVGGNAQITGTLAVSGATNMAGMTATGLTVNGTALIGGAAQITSTLAVSGATRMDGALTVNGAALIGGHVSLTSTVGISSNVNISGTLAADTIASGAAVSNTVLTANGAGASLWAYTTNYYTGIYTSTAWNADAKSGASGYIDLQTVFGLPAGIKAVTLGGYIGDETPSVIAIFSAVDPAVTGEYYAGSASATPATYIAAGINGISPCDANGDIYFYQTGELDVVYLVITGYFK